MSAAVVANSQFFALLTGVDHYLPNRMPNGGFYPSLGGCVRDINHVQAFLQSRLGLADEHIFKLTASNNTQAVSPEPPEKQPTNGNIVASFKKVKELANAGDQVYIHYSGPGGRTTGAFQGLKGPTGLDKGVEITQGQIMALATGVRSAFDFT